MDIVSIIGIILWLITLVGGMFLKGASPIALLNPAALVIIFAGTAAAIMISFPKERLKIIPALFKVIFFEQQLMTKQTLLQQFLTLSTQARKEGLLSLETALEEVDNAFMRRGVMMVIDGQPSEYVEDVMTRDPVVAEEDTSLDELILLMEKNGVKRLPVLRDDKLVGIITRANLLQAVASGFRKRIWSSRNCASSTWPGAPVSRH